MTIITDSSTLALFCDNLLSADYIAIDTEFVREKTFWSQLCLIQIAGPERAVAIDPLSPSIDLSPLIEILKNQKILKVFHAARQDLEIFVKIMGEVPSPIFDTQVAAMVCGFGDSVSYETLVFQLTNTRLDKSMRFTDWTHRPLSDLQLNYALSDVTYLRLIYEKLKDQLLKESRLDWISEEISILSNIDNYRTIPEDSFKRLKPRSNNRKFLAVLKELASWREVEAQSKNIPRSRVLRDETLLEIAAQAPTTMNDLIKNRGFNKNASEGRYGEIIIHIIQKALKIPEKDWPQVEERNDPDKKFTPIVDFLKVLLKLKADQHHVAQKLIANTNDLELMAQSDQAPILAMKGWRYDIFGMDAIKLKHGKLALALDKTEQSLRLIDLEPK